MPTPTEIRATLKARLNQAGSIMMPGAFNAAVAKLIEQLGFEAVYVSGAGLHNGVKGVPDAAILTLEEMAQFAGYIAQAVNIPVISDADTGFGGPAEVANCVRAFEAQGLAGIHIEDQLFDKRCGHLDGKKVIAIEEMQEKIRSAVSARQDPNFLIIARVDSRSISGLQDAINRANAYAEAGADVIFAEALQSEEEFARFSSQVKIPLLANMTEFGKSQYLTFKQFEQLGYKMVIYPMTTFRLMMKTIETSLLELKELGTQEGMLDKMQTRQELYQLLNYTP